MGLLSPGALSWLQGEAECPSCRTWQAAIPGEVLTALDLVLGYAEKIIYLLPVNRADLSWPNLLRPIRTPVYLFTLGKYIFYLEDSFPGTRDAWMSLCVYHPYCTRNCFQNLSHAKLTFAPFCGPWPRLFTMSELLCPAPPSFPFVWIMPGLHFNASCSQISSLIFRLG